MSNQDISPAIPFKSELDLARSGSRSATISLPVAPDSTTAKVLRGDDHKSVHSVLSTDMHNHSRTPPPTNTAPKPSTTPVAVPNLTKKARGRQVPTTKETLLKPGVAGRSYACKVENCRKVFTRSEHLKRHIRSIHTNERPFQCEEPECGKFFTRHDNLLQHRRSHRGQTSTTPTTFSGTSAVNPCDVPGPFGRVYTGNTLARESRQRQRASTDATHSIDVGATVTSDASASAASMGVLLPSPLTTTPAPSLYSRAGGGAVGESQNTTVPGPRSPPSVLSSPNFQPKTTHSMPSPITQNPAAYRLTNPLPHRGRRHSYSAVHDFAAVVQQAEAQDQGVPGPTTPSSSSPTSATSTTCASPFALNYDYTSSVDGGGGSGSPLSPGGHPAYLAAVSCYYDEQVHRASFVHEHVGFHGYQHAHTHAQLHHPPPSSHYAAAASQYAAHHHPHHQAPFVHISVPVQGEMVNGRGSYMQWRV